MDGLNHGKVQRPPRYFSEEFKRKVCEEYLSGGIAKVSLMAKYDIRGKSAILKWLRRYGYVGCRPVDTQLPPLPLEDQGNRPEAAGPLHEQIEELKKQLERERLEKEALRVLIEVAEQEYKLDFRKKPNTKQSGK